MSDSVNGVCKETQRRIRLSVAAYAYEYENVSVMSDAEFDTLSNLVDVSVKTGNKKLDTFFKKHYSPCTGMWIHKHPELSKVKALYASVYKRKGTQ